MKVDLRSIKQDKIDMLITDIKLLINTRLFENKYISKEMYIKAKELIIKQ